MRTDTIIDAACEAAGISRADYEGRCRKRRLITARGIAWKMASIVFDVRPALLAPMFDRNRQTITHAVEAFDERASRYPMYRRLYEKAWDIAWSREWGRAA